MKYTNSKNIHPLTPASGGKSGGAIKDNNQKTTIKKYTNEN